MRRAALAIASALRWRAARRVAARARQRREHAYRLVDEWRIEEADARGRGAGQGAAARSGGRVPRRQSDVPARATTTRAAERLDEAPTRRARRRRSATSCASCAIWPRRPREATQRLRRDARGEHFVIAHAPGKDALLAPYALDALESACARARRRLRRRRRREPVRVEIYPEVADLAQGLDADAQGDRDLGDDRALQVQPADDRLAARAGRRLSVARHARRTSTRTSSSRACRTTRCRSGCTRGWPSSRSGAGARPSGGGLTPTMEHLLATRRSQRKHLITFERDAPVDGQAAVAGGHRARVRRGLHGRRVPAREGRLGRACARSSRAARRARATRRRWRRWWASRSTSSSATGAAGCTGEKLRAQPGPGRRAELRFKKGGGKPTEAERGRLGAHRRGAGAQAGAARRHAARAASARGGGARVREGAGARRAGQPAVANKLARTYLELGDADARDRRRRAGARALSRPGGAQRDARRGVAQEGRPREARRRTSRRRSRSTRSIPALHCALADGLRSARTTARAAREEAACRALGRVTRGRSLPCARGAGCAVGGSQRAERSRGRSGRCRCAWWSRERGARVANCVFSTAELLRARARSTRRVQRPVRRRRCRSGAAATCPTPGPSAPASSSTSSPSTASRRVEQAYDQALPPRRAGAARCRTAKSCARCSRRSPPRRAPRRRS